MKLLRRLDRFATGVLIGGALLGIYWLGVFLVGAYRNKRPIGYGRTAHR